MYRRGNGAFKNDFDLHQNLSTDAVLSLAEDLSAIDENTYSIEEGVEDVQHKGGNCTAVSIVSAALKIYAHDCRDSGSRRADRCDR